MFPGVIGFISPEISPGCTKEENWSLRNKTCQQWKREPTKIVRVVVIKKDWTKKGKGKKEESQGNLQRNNKNKKINTEYNLICKKLMCFPVVPPKSIYPFTEILPRTIRRLTRRSRLGNDVACRNFTEVLPRFFAAQNTAVNSKPR